MLATQDQSLSIASWIHPKLWQGSKYALRSRSIVRFNLVVLCAAEVQVLPASFPGGIKVIRCPLRDEETPLSAQDANQVMHAAQRCARSVLRGRRTLISCNAGLNRSGLVMATTLHLLTGQPGFECARVVQRRRPGALYNRTFLRELYRLF